MADRTVAVSLVLNAQGYMQGMDKASVKTRELGSAAEKLAQQQQSFQTLGTAAVGFGAVVGAGVGVAVSKFAEFDEQMAYVQAATHETAGGMDLLREAALEAGASTVFSATEAAQAVEELSKAGISTADVLSGALTGSMDLAAAGGLGVSRAAEISATALQQFGLEGSGASHVADVLAAGAGKAMGSVEDLSNGLKFVGPIAASMGISIEETTGTLALFAQQGIIGEQAGTSLRGMLSSLTSPSAQARTELERLGITLYDSSGNFKGMENAAGQLSSAYSGMTGQARDASLGIIFGNQQITAATALYSAGAEGVAEWTDAVNDSGYAAETAAMRLDNLKGDWEAFTGALDTAMISMGEGADGPLRAFVQELTGMVDGFNALPDWAQQTALGVGGLTAAVALGGGTFMLAVPKIAAYNAAVATMGAGAQRASRLVGTLAKGAGAAAGFLALAKGAEMAADAMGQMGDGAKTANETMSMLLEKDYNGIFDGISPSIEGVNDAMATLLDSDPGTAFNRWGSDMFAWTGLKSSVGDARAQFALLGDSLADLVNRGEGDLAAEMFEEIRARAEKQGYTVEQLNEIMPQYEDALAGVANESVIAGAAVDDAATDIEAMEAAAAEAKTALDAAAEALTGLHGNAMAMGEAKDAALTALNAMAEAADAEGAALDGSNDASIRLRDTVREVEDAHRLSAEAIINNGGTLADAQAEWDKGREAVINMIEAKTGDREEAIRWADQQLGSASEVKAGIDDVYQAWLNLPENKETKYQVDAAAAEQKLADLRAALDAIPNVTYKRVQLDSFTVGNFDVSIPGTDNATGNFFQGGKVKDLAAGGWASGVGMAPATPGGLLRIAEAGFDEAVISTDPQYRDRSLGIWAEMGGRLGAFQPAPYSVGASGSGPSEQRPFNNTQNIYAQPGMSEAQVASISADRLDRALRGA